MLGSKGSMSKLNYPNGSKTTIDNFSHETSNLPIGPEKLADRQFHHTFLRGDAVDMAY